MVCSTAERTCFPRNERAVREPFFLATLVGHNAPAFPHLFLLKTRRAAALLSAALAIGLPLARPRAALAGLDDYNTTAEPIETVELVMGAGDSGLEFSPSTLNFTAGRCARPGAPSRSRRIAWRRAPVPTLAPPPSCRPRARERHIPRGSTTGLLIGHELDLLHPPPGCTSCT